MTRTRDVVSAQRPPGRAFTLTWAPAMLVVGALTPLAFASTALAVAGYVLVVFAYVPPLPRLVALLQERRRVQNTVTTHGLTRSLEQSVGRRCSPSGHGNWR